MSDTYTTHVERPQLLSQAGHTAREVAGEFHRAADTYATTLTGASGALSGGNWSGQLGRAITEAGDTWREQASDLVNGCRWVGEACTSTASNYLTNEALNTEIFSHTSPADTPFG